jgi:hypothetical protein
MTAEIIFHGISHCQRVHGALLLAVPSRNSTSHSVYLELGKTTLAKQVYDTIKGQFSCSAFVSVSRTPDLRKILIHISSGVGFTGYTQDNGEQQLIDKIRNHLHCKR